MASVVGWWCTFEIWARRDGGRRGHVGLGIIDHVFPPGVPTTDPKRDRDCEGHQA